MAKLLHGHIKNCFSCDSKDVIYILICKTCDNFYLGQTQDFKQRTAKHKSDVKNPHNTTCRICSEDLRGCNQAQTYFQIFPFLYETNTALRKYIEKLHSQMETSIKSKQNVNHDGIDQ